MANFLGFKESIGIRVKQTMNSAKAARLRPPKTKRRSHRLTRLVSACDWWILVIGSFAQLEWSYSIERELDARQSAAWRMQALQPDHKSLACTLLMLDVLHLLFA